MGGDGSGNFRLHKDLVEDAICLSMSRLQKISSVGANRLVSGTYRSQDARFNACRIDVTWDPSGDVVLSYFDGGRAKKESVPWGWSGGRLYFKCPDCSSLRDRLYLPPGRMGFRCRVCHDLTYSSTRRSQKMPKGFMDFAMPFCENDPEAVRRLWRR